MIAAGGEEASERCSYLGFLCARAYISKMNREATIKRLKEDLAASAADIEAGRIVPGEVVLARLQQALAQYEAEQHHDKKPAAAIRR